jgi:serine/threonine protein kinase
MIQKIGRYSIKERIGRGGMGTVFKAHDPMLDRLVAIKVISSEGEITDELKTRFYREAQACARLIHPNIVVVHDLGEDQGRLYIVMEFLDGEELKALINQRKPLSTQDKVSLMSQVCEGLHYAHQNGVIHRDIKPGNIFILRNGQVKILDFGIARIATTDSGLTRTGLIMGTLRYMSPEQARGKVDHRSDMFSAGTVFYELLGYKAAFDSDDPMETLEKLRSEDPTSLTEIDPSIPTDLVQIVEKALKKNPDHRFPDMGQMKSRLEQVRRRISDEAEQLLAHVRELLEELRELQERLAGAGEADDATIPVVDERTKLPDLQALKRHLETRIEQLRESARQLDTIQPRVTRATQLLEAGDTAGATAELEGVLRDAPNHAQARALLEQVQARVQEAGRLLEQAKAAHQRHEHARCLELLAGLPGAAAGAPAAAALRQAAETAQREQAQATAARDAVAPARAAAAKLEAARHAAAAWTEAEAKAGEGTRALEQHAYASARGHFQEAVSAYERAAAAAGQAIKVGQQEQAQAEAARQEVATARAAAEQVDAAHQAPAAWTEAEAKAADAARALGQRAYGVARAGFQDALAAYVGAATAARDAAAKQAEAQARAETARRTAADARQKATEARAASLAAGKWAAAQAKEKGAQTAAGRKDYAAAESAFAEALRLYEEATREAVAEAEAANRARDQQAELERLRQVVATARRAADEAGAGRRATGAFARAKAAEQAAVEAVGRQAFDEAVSRLRAAEQAYQEATEEVRTEKAKAEQAAQDASQAKQAAVALNPASHASSAGKWSAAQAREGAGQAAFGRGDWTAAQTLLGEARRLYDEAAGLARAVASVEDRRKAAEAESARLRDAVAAARRAAEEAGAAQAATAQAELLAGRTAEQAAETALARHAHDEAQSQFRAAERAYEDAARHASAQQAVSAAVAEAQRLIAEGHADRALEPLARVRESDPKHPELPKLEAQIKRLADERKRREQVQSLLTQARRLQTQGDLARALRYAEEAVQIAPTDAAAVRLRDGLQEAAAEAEPATVPPVTAPPTPVSRPPERRPAPREREPEVQRPPRQGLGAKQIGIGAAAGLLLIVGVYFLWPTQTPPPREARSVELVVETLPPGAPQRVTGDVTRIDGSKVTIKSGGQTYEFPFSADALKDLKVGDLVEARFTVKPDTGRARAEDARKSMAAARDEAAKAEGDKSRSWAPAAEKEREGDAALGKQDFAGALSAYNEARAGYSRAAKEATEQRDLALKLKGVREQQDQAAQARSRAQGLEAPTLAGDLWNKALALEKSADEALKRLEFDRAVGLAKEAEQVFKAAGDQAGKQQGEEARAAAAAASEATKARQAAEQVEASRYAKDLFAQAEERLRLGQTATDAKDHRTARGRYVDARDRYVQAKQEADNLRGGLAARQKDAEQFRDRMVQARSQADQANARSLVTRVYQDAAAKESDAQQLFSRADGHAAGSRFREAQQEYERAKQRFGEAQQGYETATKEARAVAKDLMDKARGGAVASREQADKAEAEKLAKDLFDAAAAKQAQADGLANRQDYAAATPLYQDAGRGFDSALKRAREVSAEQRRVAEEQRKQEEARRQAALAEEQRKQEEARRQAAAELQRKQEEARRQAALAEEQRKQEEARRQAALAEEQRKQEEARRQAALAEQQRKQEEARRQAALAEEQRKQEEARRQAAAAEEQRKQEEARRQAALAEQQRKQVAAAQAKDTMEKARAQMNASRDAALRGEADKLARDLFAEAKTREGQAETLAKKEAHLEASAAFREAEQAYDGAARRAGVLRPERAEADQAKLRMQAEKQKAKPDAPDYAAAIAQERQGDQTYARLAFKDAAGHYNSAAGLFAKLPPTPPPVVRPPAADPKKEIEAVLNSYKRAIEGKDLGLYQQVYPGVTKDNLRKVEQSFLQMQSQTLDFRDLNIDIDGDAATAKGRRFDVLVPKGGREIRNESAFVIRLRKTAAGWVIQAMN